MCVKTVLVCFFSFLFFFLCVFLVAASENAASSGVSSCAGPGGRIGRRSASRRRTGRVWRPCASGSDVSARPNGRSASRSCPTCTCTASHLQEEGEKRKTGLKKKQKKNPELEFSRSHDLRHSNVSACDRERS